MNDHNCSIFFIQRFKLFICFLNQYQFNCNICESSFTQKGQMSRHVASVHEGKKPFKCNICATRFARKTHLNACLERLIKDRIFSNIIFIMQALNQRCRSIQKQFMKKISLSKATTVVLGLHETHLNDHVVSVHVGRNKNHQFMK